MRRDPALLFLFGAMAVAAMGCRPDNAKKAEANAAAAALTDGDREAIRSEIARFDQHVMASDWASATAQYTDDAILLPPNMSEVHGKEAIRKFLSGFPKMTLFKETVEAIDGDAEYAYPQGTYETEFTPPGSKTAVKEKGKVMGVWRKQSDGSWKVSRVIWNSDKAPGM